MKKIYILCLWAIIQAGYAQEKQPKLTKDSEGKYFVLFHENEPAMSAEKGGYGKVSFFLKFDNLPTGTQVLVRNNCLNQVLPMIVKHRVEYASYIETEKDSLTDFIEMFSMNTINNDCFEIKCYVPIDSIMKVSEKQTNRVKLISFKYLFDFMRKLHLQEATEYGQKALELAKLTQNLDAEAELWFALGELKNENVGKYFKLDRWGSKRKNYQEVIQEIAKETNFLPADIRRWNHLWGYANEFSLYYREFGAKLYDNPAMLSDKEYLEYLKIRIAQRDTNKIVWIYNTLGDLYQIKHGYEEAEKYYLEMLNIRTQQNDKQKIYWVWGHLGYFYLKQEKFDLAMTYFTKLLEARKQEKNIEQIIWALGGLRYTKLTQGLPEEALAYQKQIFELYAELKQAPDKYYGEKPAEYRYLILSVIIGDCLKSFPDKAKAILDYLIKWRKDSPDSKENKIIANKIIEIATESGELDSAIEVIKEIIKIEKDAWAKIDYLNDVAFMYQKQGKYADSKTYYEYAMKTAKKSAVPLLIATQHKKIAYFYRVQNKDKEAKGAYKRLIGVMQKMEKPAYSDKEYYKEYKHYLLIEDLLGVCEYLDTFPDTKEQAKHLAKEAIRLSDNEFGSYQFKKFLKR